MNLCCRFFQYCTCSAVPQMRETDPRAIASACAQAYAKADEVLLDSYSAVASGEAASGGNRELSISQVRQISIFVFQSFWTEPSQMVPLINQQSLPA